MTMRVYHILQSLSSERARARAHVVTRKNKTSVMVADNELMTMHSCDLMAVL